MSIYGSRRSIFGSNWSKIRLINKCLDGLEKEREKAEKTKKRKRKGVTYLYGVEAYPYSVIARPNKELTVPNKARVGLRRVVVGRCVEESC